MAKKAKEIQPKTDCPECRQPVLNCICEPLEPVDNRPPSESYFDEQPYEHEEHNGQS